MTATIRTFNVNRTPHLLDLPDVTMYLAEKEFEVTSAVIPGPLGIVKMVDGKTKDYSLMEKGSFRKHLGGRLDGTLTVFLSLSGVVDSPDIVFKGHNLVAAVAAYNGLG